MNKAPGYWQSKGVNLSLKSQEHHQFKTSINQFSPEHGHPTPIFSKVICCKTFPDKRSDVCARKRMDLMSISVLSESPSFMNFGLTPANTPDKLKSVIVPTTRVERLTNGSDWILTKHNIEEVTVERVGEAKAYRDYILKMSLKLWKILSEKIFLGVESKPFHHWKTEKSNSPFIHKKMEKSNSPFHHQKMENRNSPFHHCKTEKRI